VRLPAAAFLLLATARLTPLDESVYARLLEANRGKVVLVNFWATWCEPCRQEMPHLAEMERRYRGRGFVLLTVSADEPEQEADAYRFLEQAGIRSPAYLKRVKNDDRFITFVDKEWSGALPATFVFDRAGVKRHSFIGETELKELDAAVEKLL
jgi:thiol-disulfide isomerase/thioredoxin